MRIETWRNLCHSRWFYGTRVYQLWLLSTLALLTCEDRKLCLVAEGPNKGLTDLKELIEAGKLVPAIDSLYRLSEVPETLRYFGEGRHKGKLVISMKNEIPASGPIMPLRRE